MHHFNQNRKPQILVVDDELEIIEQLSSLLASAGLSCHCARSCEQAIELARTVTPDLIISDINLAGYSGLRLCERLRQEEGLLDVPLMFLSGAQIPDIVRRSHAAGGTYYLRKPFDPQVLLELVDKALWIPHLATAR